MLTVRIKHGQRKLIMDIFSLDRIFGKICKKISCPVIIPFIIKADVIILHTSGEFRPEAIFLCDRKRSRKLLIQNRIQMLEKFHRFQIFI